MGGRSAFSVIVRFIAGGYIMYLGYQLISGYLNPTEETGDPVWYALACGIAFLAIGAFIIIDMIRKLAGGSKEEAETEEAEASEIESSESTEEITAEAKAEEENQEAQEAPAQPMSIADRIRRLSAEDGEDEEAGDPEEKENN